MTTHTIIVGNLGTVCTTTSAPQAHQEYLLWIEVSKANTGRAAGEPVTWMRDGEPYKEYTPPTVTVHNFRLAVTAPADLTRDEVRELLTVFSNAATVELEGCASNDDEEEADKAEAALKLNIEILP